MAEARPNLLRVSRPFDHVTWLTESVSSVVLLMICDTRNLSFRMKADKGQYFCFISRCACFYTWPLFFVLQFYGLSEVFDLHVTWPSRLYTYMLSLIRQISKACYLKLSRASVTLVFVEFFGLGWVLFVVSWAG